MYNFNDLSAKEALEIIEPIPEDKFITHQYYDQYDETKCCLLGHLNRAAYANDENFSEPEFRAKAKRFLLNVKKIREIPDGKGNFRPVSILAVNDTNLVNGWTQNSIKERDVAFLKEMAAWEAGEI